MTRFFTLSLVVFMAAVSFSQKVSDDKTLITNGEEVHLNNLNIFITPPKGYKYLEENASFINSPKYTSISVVRRSGVSYNQFVKVLGNKRSKTQGAKLLSAREYKKGMVFNYEFTIDDNVIERLMYVIQDGDDVVYAMANYRKLDRLLVYHTLKNSISSIKCKE